LDMVAMVAVMHLELARVSLLDLVDLVVRE
jgi:hypothetical protein